MSQTAGRRPGRPLRTLALLTAGIPLAVWFSLACKAERPGYLAGDGAGGATGEEPAAQGGSTRPLLQNPYFANMTVEKNVAVPMRDGVVLRADIYRPASPGRFPTLVYRTPYGKDDLVESGSEPTVVRAARAGYAVVVQDVRGRYHSDGEFRPYHQEGRDGFDTIEWAAAQ
ncbi:MAG TPA: CocE/NonD family hydrolase, partial [Candidatus Polarisedimenticolia bacterium]|nr:CocE/NonD family hydrolase [Candidatus Polarisedimenticolia bacterium]